MGENTRLLFKSKQECICLLLDIYTLMVFFNLDTLPTLTHLSQNKCIPKSHNSVKKMLEHSKPFKRQYVFPTLSSKCSSVTISMQFNVEHAIYENLSTILSTTLTVQRVPLIVLAGDWSTLHEPNFKYSLYKTGSEGNESLSRFEKANWIYCFLFPKLPIYREKYQTGKG